MTGGDVAAGAAVPFETADIRAASGSITRTDETALTLAPGTYLVSFASDVTGTDADVGAALSNTAGTIAYAVSSVPVTGTQTRRVTLTTILAPTAQESLSVVNPTGGALNYANSSLTVTKLS